MTDTKILLSTDIGSDIDDALALDSIINKEMNLIGIYTVNGDVKSRAYIAKHMVDLARKSIDVAIGESEPLGGDIKPYYYYEDCYIDDKFIDRKKSSVGNDTTYKQPEEVGILSKGVEDLAEKLAKERYAVLSIAPLTNIARLIEKYPRASKNIEKLYVGGCRFNDGEKHEHNIRFDIPAAIKVFNSDIPISVVPANLWENYQMPVEQLGQLRESAMGRYVKGMAVGFLGVKTAQKLVHLTLGELAEFKGLTKESALINSLGLVEFIKYFVKSEVDLVAKYGRDKIDEILDLKNKLVADLNECHHAGFERDGYFKQYYELVEHLRNPELNYIFGKRVANSLESIVPREISIADVYVPYCFDNPECIKTERANVEIDERGISHLAKGDRHEIVKSVDFEHLKQFISSFLK